MSNRQVIFPVYQKPLTKFIGQEFCYLRYLTRTESSSILKFKRLNFFITISGCCIFALLEIISWKFRRKCMKVCSSANYVEHKRVNTLKLIDYVLSL
jgi:hypothetical protein